MVHLSFANFDSVVLFPLHPPDRGFYHRSKLKFYRHVPLLCSPPWRCQRLHDADAQEQQHQQVLRRHRWTRARSEARQGLPQPAPREVRAPAPEGCPLWRDLPPHRQAGPQRHCSLCVEELQQGGGHARGPLPQACRALQEAAQCPCVSHEIW
ncbi:kinetoplast-associated protein, putative [Bodo saltans]|uniref:Kinetoplast-associated protein, putative n=1 Tax=Bodo saltans TaxID=75058 RepID=A0A0S4JDV7_BODSA|nr:kinetoplast-associated protein, putative [Bodo saltans]|eukprot:CUG88301.1 kinetoplast-associated protein, putative [Bodo saltans]